MYRVGVSDTPQKVLHSEVTKHFSHWKRYVGHLGFPYLDDEHVSRNFKCSFKNAGWRELYATVSPVQEVFIGVCRLVNLKIDFIPKRPCHHWLPQWGDYYRRDSPEVPEATKSVISIQLIFFSLVKHHCCIKVNGWSHILNFLYIFFTNIFVITLRLYI